MYYRRNLPHYQPLNASYFITFRLSGSLPKIVLEKLREEHEIVIKRLEKITNSANKKEEIYNTSKYYFKKYDEYLNKCLYGPKWLKDDLIAQIVADAIHSRTNTDYELIAYSIMPNHVHMVASLFDDDKIGISAMPLEADKINQDEGKIKNRTEVRHTVAYKNYRLTDILRGIKGSTARECNKVLKRSGAFWHHESYDHVIRNEGELHRTIWYVLNNPVKANLVNDWRKWRWSYCKYEL